VLAVGDLTEQGDTMARARWNDLDPRRRRLLLIGAAVDADGAAPLSQGQVPA
jgi:hypothetical protein